MRGGRALLVGAAVLAAFGACATEGAGGEDEGVVLTFPASSVGAERRVLERQVARYERTHPGVRIELVEVPDAADQRHQLYVQWLNAGVARPDVLQLDVVWLDELAAAGWIRPLDAAAFDEGAFIPRVWDAAHHEGRLHAVPWFVDVGMLYWRTDLLDRAPRSFEELRDAALRAKRAHGLRYGLVWQGARYEGLVAVFLEHLGGFGGDILRDGRVTVDDPPAYRALGFMRRSVHVWGLVPRAALGWQEERARFAFQNGDAVLMRNWPYAFALMSDPAESRVAGRFAVAPMPAAPGGRPTATLGGQQLAVNAHSAHPREAEAFIRFLAAPAQMRERFRRTGQLPARSALYDSDAVQDGPHVPLEQARRVVERARPRPATPAYTEVSQELQVQVHRALTRQADPEDALREAAAGMRSSLAALERERGTAGAAPEEPRGPFVAALVLAALLAAALTAWWRRGRGPDGREARAAWSLAAPAVAVLLVAAVFPLGWTFWESLHAHDLRAPWRGRTFVGLGNYAELAGDARFWGALRNTAVFAGAGLALELVLGLALALLLDRWRRGRGFVRATVLLPWALPTVVAGLVWRFLFEGEAAAAQAVASAAAQDVAWLAHPVAAWVPVILADVWKTTPFVALLLLAGLSTIDGDLYEAARMDGAGPWQRFRHVTLPLLGPTLRVAVLFRAMDALRVFGLIYVLTGGGPGTATEPLALYTHEVLLGHLRFGYGSALSVAVFLVTAAVALVLLAPLGRRRPEVVS
ncbi:MAG: extracellular solute-binding protein [Myxococcota bacterium]